MSSPQKSGPKKRGSNIQKLSPASTPRQPLRAPSRGPPPGLATAWPVPHLLLRGLPSLSRKLGPRPLSLVLGTPNPKLDGGEDLGVRILPDRKPTRPPERSAPDWETPGQCPNYARQGGAPGSGRRRGVPGPGFRSSGRDRRAHTNTNTHTHSHTLTFLALRRRGRHQNAAPKEREAGAGCSPLHDALQARSLVPTLATGRSRARSLAAGLPHARTPARWPQDPLQPGPAAREQLLSLQPESLMEVG